MDTRTCLPGLQAGSLICLLLLLVADVVLASMAACAPEMIATYLEFAVVNSSFNYSALPFITDPRFDLKSLQRTGRSGYAPLAVEHFGADAVFQTLPMLRARGSKVVLPRAQEGAWRFRPGNPCGFEPTEYLLTRNGWPFDDATSDVVADGVQRDEGGRGPFDAELEADKRRAWVERILRSKNILFVGDSTMRNMLLTLAAMLCNPLHFAECTQVAALLNAYGHDGADAMSCFAGAARTNRCLGSDAAPYLTLEHVSFGNLTARHMYKSRAERKRFWAQGRVPPMTAIRVPSLNCNLFFLSASCGSPKDGIFRVLSFLAVQVNVSTREFTTRPQHPGGAANHTDFLPQLDAVVMSTGPHCSYRHAQFRWFYKLAHGMTTLLAPLKTRIVWSEPLNCLKGAPNETRIPSGRSDAKTSCSFLAASMPAVTKMMKRLGHFVAPMGAVTRRPAMMHQLPVKAFRRLWAEESAQECVFVDALHPAVPCNSYLVVVLLQTLRLAMASQGSAAVEEAAPVNVSTDPQTAQPSARPTLSSTDAHHAQVAEMRVQLVAQDLQRRLIDDVWAFTSGVLATGVALFMLKRCRTRQHAH